MPEHTECVGLLALMELHNARRHGRVDADGEFLPLDEQDRSTWDLDAIRTAIARLETAERSGDRGPYLVQAGIAACHAIAPVAAATDWKRIAALYDQLVGLMPTPVVQLNRAVAVGMAEGPEAGLALVDELDASGALAGYHLLAATRADFLRRLGRAEEAVTPYELAITQAVTERDRRFLRRRIDELS
jgi:RNA polymerase sigma-70 factor (ECF subfamily)